VRFGLAAGALALAKHGARRWLRWGTLVFVDQPIARDGPRTAGPEVIIRESGPADLAALARTFERDRADLAARLARGDRAFCAFAADDAATPLHMRWATRAPTAIPEAALWLCAGADEVYVYDTITVSDARGHGLAGAARAVMDRALADMGCVRKLAYVRADNHAMRRSLAIAHPPFRELFRLGYVQRVGARPIVLGRPRPPVYPSPTR
jgi:hypothetical protein